MKSLFSLLFFITVTVNAQFQFQINDSIALPNGFQYQLNANSLNEIYIIKNGTDLIKINQKKETLQYPKQKIITHLDANLGLKTAVVYNHQELQILDDKLNPIQDPINLNQYEIFPSSIAIIDSQLLWYFDPIEQRLIQWNYQLKKTINKSNLLFFKEGDSTIEEIYNYKNRIFLKSQNYIYEYDFFGNFKSDIPLKQYDKSFFSGDKIYLIKDQNLTEINLINQEISTADNFFYGKDFIMSDDQLFVITQNVMYIYTRIKN
jgi:hypothetical protein